MTRVGDFIYGLALRSFPAAFRRRHGRAMASQFRLQRDSLAGRPAALASLWVRGLTDAVRHGLVERRERRPGRRRPVEGLFMLSQDVRYAVRRLLHDRRVTVVVVLMLALGLGANAAMFSVVDQLLFRPPAGVGEPGGVRTVYLRGDGPGGPVFYSRSSYPRAAAIRDGVTAFAGASVTYRDEVTIGGGPGALEASVELVDASYFTLLRLAPAAGRFFTAAEAVATSAAPVAVISHGLWQRAFAGDPAVVGSTVRAEGRPLTVVGVAPEGFLGVEASAIDLWAPLGALAPTLVGPAWESNFFRYGYGVIARLADDGTDELAGAQATAAHNQARPPEGMPGVSDADAVTVPMTGLSAPDGLSDTSLTGVWLLAVAVLVLLVAVANVTHVLLTRMLERRREIAVRLALGVSRRRLVRQLLTEVILLGGTAAAVALLVAQIGGAVLHQAVLPSYPRAGGVVDGRVFGFTLAITTLAMLAAGLSPMLHALRTDVAGSLRATARLTGGGNGRLRAGLVVVQVAFSVLVLVAAGLFLKSLVAVRAVDTGLDLERLILVRLPERPGTAREEAERLHAAAVERLQAMPRVTGVTLSRGSAPMGISSATSVLLEGESLSDLNGVPSPGQVVVEPGYFEVLGASIVRGRGLTAADAAGATRVALVNLAMREQRWKGADPIGRCIYFGSGAECTRVVGIVENVLQYDRVGMQEPQVYLLTGHPAAARALPRGILVRTDGDPADLVAPVRSAMQALTPDMPFVPVDTLESLTAPQLQSWRTGTTMLLVFGGVALVMAITGIHGALSYAMSLRAREIGIRMALGASRGRVLAHVGAQGARAVTAGLVLGLAVAAVAGASLTELLFETSPRDPIVFAGVAVLLGFVAIPAVLGPARRVASVDPASVLRVE